MVITFKCTKETIISLLLQLLPRFIFEAAMLDHAVTAGEKPPTFKVEFPTSGSFC